MLRQQHRFFVSLLVACDGVILVGADVAAYWARFKWVAPMAPPKESSWAFATHAIPVLVVVPILLLTMRWAGLYKPRRDQRFLMEAGAILKAVVVGVGVTIAVMFFLRNLLFGGYLHSSLQFALFAALAATLLIAWRFVFRTALRVLRSRGLNLRHVAIIGTGRLGQVVFHTLTRNSWTGITPQFFVSHQDKAGLGTCLGLPVRGGLDDLDEILGSPGDRVSGVFIALPGEMSGRMGELMTRLERYPVDVRVVPDMNPRFLPVNMAVNDLDGMPVLSVRESPMSGWGRVSKRTLDILGGLAALVIFAIPMILIAIVVRLSGRGPVIFRQERMSLNGQRFKIFKFRTMAHVDAERQMIRDSGKGTDAWTKPTDPRITRFGRFLRQTSLDELPQLFNVLIGEMSLVGPRPERPELIERFREDWRGYMLRQHVKAGMTGWAQVNGLRGDTSLKKRLQYDLFYIRNWSLMFDLRILLLTLFRGFAHRNAY